MTNPHHPHHLRPNSQNPPRSFQIHEKDPKRHLNVRDSRSSVDVNSTSNFAPRNVADDTKTAREMEKLTSRRPLTERVLRDSKRGRLRRLELLESLKYLPRSPPRCSSPFNETLRRPRDVDTAEEH